MPDEAELARRVDITHRAVEIARRALEFAEAEAVRALEDYWLFDEPGYVVAQDRDCSPLLFLAGGTDASA